MQNSFKDREYMHYSLLIFNPFLPICWLIPRFLENTWERGKGLPAAFQKSSVPKSQKWSTNQKRRIMYTLLSSKSSANSKGFGVKWLRLINSRKKVEFNKIINSWPIQYHFKSILMSCPCPFKPSLIGNPSRS
jgi:hypothetical protein